MKKSIGSTYGGWNQFVSSILDLLDNYYIKITYQSPRFLLHFWIRNLFLRIGPLWWKGIWRKGKWMIRGWEGRFRGPEIIEAPLGLDWVFKLILSANKTTFYPVRPFIPVSVPSSGREIPLIKNRIFPFFRPRPWLIFIIFFSFFRLVPFLFFRFFSGAFFDLFFIFSRTETINHPRTVAHCYITRSFVCWWVSLFDV